MPSEPKLSRCLRSSIGFTLIEVMIVIGIFAVIAGISYSALTQYIDVQQRLTQRTDQLQQLQRTFTLLERDLRYVIDRDTRDRFGDREDAFSINYSNGLPGEIFRFTTIHPDYAMPVIGSIHRVAWTIEDEVLSRITWDALNQDADTQYQSMLVLNAVTDVEIEQTTWSAIYGLQTGLQSPGFPSGVKLTFTLSNGFNYSRVFDIANGT